MMKKRICVMGIIFMLAVSTMEGCLGEKVSETTAQVTEPADETITISPIEKISVNFEGRVTVVKEGEVTLENGKTILISDETRVSLPDGSTGEIAVGDYIQRYAKNPEENELKAAMILITPL